MNDLIQVEYNFTDLTLIEADGEFKKCHDLFKKDNIKVNEWMLDTDFDLKWFTKKSAPIQDSGIMTGKLHYYSDGIVYIIVFHSSSANNYSRDLEILTQWIKGCGWKKIKPHPDLVRENLDYWKHYWETFIVDSDFLDIKYGKREDKIYADNEDRL